MSERSRAGSPAEPRVVRAKPDCIPVLGDRLVCASGFHRQSVCEHAVKPRFNRLEPDSSLKFRKGFIQPLRSHRDFMLFEWRPADKGTRVRHHHRKID